MLDQLKQSTESDDLIKQASAYLVRLKQGVANKKKRQADKQAGVTLGGKKGQVAQLKSSGLIPPLKGNGDQKQANGAHNSKEMVDKLTSQSAAKPVNTNLRTNIILGEPYETIEID
jgi:hypothetical protein